MREAPDRSAARPLKRRNPRNVGIPEYTCGAEGLAPPAAIRGADPGGDPPAHATLGDIRPLALGHEQTGAVRRVAQRLARSQGCGGVDADKPGHRAAPY